MQKDILNHIHGVVTTAVEHLNRTARHETASPEMRVAMLDAQIALTRLETQLLDEKRRALIDTSHPIP